MSSLRKLRHIQQRGGAENLMKRSADRRQFCAVLEPSLAQSWKNAALPFTGKAEASLRFAFQAEQSRAHSRRGFLDWHCWDLGEGGEYK